MQPPIFHIHEVDRRNFYIVKIYAWYSINVEKFISDFRTNTVNAFLTYCLGSSSNVQILSTCLYGNSFLVQKDCLLGNEIVKNPTDHCFLLP